MSISVVKYRDPRLDINPNRIYSVPISGQKFTVRDHNASSVSSNTISYDITTPSIRIGLQRKLELFDRFIITCGGANVNLAALQNRVGPRAWPMHSIMQLCTLELNDQSISFAPYEYIHALMNYSTDITDRDIWLSGDVHYPDNNITYL